jgi:molybdate transport system ATP-binding protein
MLDEPLANLDRVSRQRCLACLMRVAEESGLPMLYVSHDIEEISQIADRLLMLDQGRLVEQGPFIELAGRLDTRLAHETRAAAIVLGSVARHDEAYGLTELSLEGQSLWVNRLSAEPGQVRRVRIPARDVSVARSASSDTSILNSFETRLLEIEESEGSRVLLRLALGRQFLLARVTRKSADQLALQPGDTLYAQVKSAALLTDGVSEQ